MKPSIALAFLFPSLLAAQTTIRVPADVPTIQGAIEVAQDGDTVLVAAGSYNGRHACRRGRVPPSAGASDRAQRHPASTLPS